MADDPARLLADQRAAQLQADARVQQRLIADYNQAWQRILDQLRAINQAVTSARAAGVPVDQAWIERYLREHRVDRAVEQTIVRYVEQIEPRIATATRVAGVAGATDAERLTLATITGVVPTTLPVEETAAMAAALRPGAPLRALLDEMGRTASLRAREALVTAVALGRNPRETARDLRAVTGQTLARALRISRTETIGAYRRAAIERYRAHSDVLEGWVWVASLSPRTCAACLAMHGTVHSLDEPFASHPVCRCSPAPLTRTWDQLLGRPTGLRETRLVARSAVGWLDSQSRSTRLAILGPGKLRELDAGRIRLADLAQPTLHPVWGPGIRETPLRDLVAGGA